MIILIPGCCGYIGSKLIPHLLAYGHKIIGIDPQWFGDGFLQKNNEYFELYDSFSDFNRKSNNSIEAVIYLAGMTNDKSCQQNEALAQQMNVEVFEPFIKTTKKLGVKRFIFLSSAAVYGTTGEPEREDYDPQPETLYCVAKIKCERILKPYTANEFETVILRPAGVCGYAPRMRFDLMVNAMVRDAFFTGKINVHGGDQLRPHLHIRDLVESIHLMLHAPAAKINGQIFNIVKQNLKVIDVASIVKQIAGGEIELTPRQDSRSYAIMGNKFSRSIFTPFWTIKEAVKELYIKFQEGYFRDAMTNPGYSNVYPTPI